jgi:spermidine/putrescine-binding protein
MTTSGLIRVRTFGAVSRRVFTQGMLATGGLAAAGLTPRAVMAATEVNFLGWQGYDTALAADGYLEDNDIAVNATYMASSEDITTKLAAGGMGVIDIVTPYNGSIPLLVGAGFLEPVDPSLVPNLANIMPIFRNDKTVNFDGELWGVPFTWGSLPLMYDPAVVPEAPESWYELFKPEYTGKVGMLDDPLSNIMVAARITTDAKDVTMLTPDQLETAISFLIKLKPQLRLIAVSYGDLADAMARGDIALIFSGWEALKSFAAAKGKVIEYTHPKEGTTAFFDSYCFPTNAPNRAIDHALANKIIDVPAQLEIGNDFLQGAMNLEAIDQLNPEARALYPYDNMASFAEKATFHGHPPEEAPEGYMSFDDWKKAYQRFKSS